MDGIRHEPVYGRAARRSDLRASLCARAVVREAQRHDPGEWRDGREHRSIHFRPIRSRSGILHER